LLPKNPIRKAPRSFLRADLQPIKDYVFQTSGSTGTPIKTIWTKQEVRKRIAVREARYLSSAGVSYEMPRATFSGRMVEPDPYSPGPYYRYNAVEKQVYFSAFHLGPKTASKYVHALGKHKIMWLTGYAYSYYLLARLILDQKLDVPPLKAVITTSEKVTPEMKQVMEAVYQCPVFEEYGTVENVLFAQECEYGNLHTSPDIAIIEILKGDRTPCAPGEIGEIVTTRLAFNYQVFIRYRLGDFGSWSDLPCSCGKAMPILKEVTGRIEDAVISPDGRQMVRFHGIFTDQPNVCEGQIIQEDLTKIRVKIVPTENFNEADILDIRARVQQRLGSKVDVAVE